VSAASAKPELVVTPDPAPEPLPPDSVPPPGGAPGRPQRLYPEVEEDQAATLLSAFAKPPDAAAMKVVERADDPLADLSRNPSSNARAVLTPPRLATPGTRRVRPGALVVLVVLAVAFAILYFAYLRVAH
jgi:hypothetical protein